MVGLHIFFVFLAAFGLFGFLWAVLGFFLPHCRKGRILCSAPDFVPVYLWLRGFGIVTCPMAILDTELTEEQRIQFLAKDIELYTPESLILELRKDLP